MARQKIRIIGTIPGLDSLRLDPVHDRPPRLDALHRGEHDPLPFDPADGRPGADAGRAATLQPHARTGAIHRA